MLRACATERTPFDGPVPANEAVHWIEPKLVAEVTFTGWTNEPHLRHAVYLGLRDDVDPRGITLESARVPAVEGERDEPVGEARRADVARHAKGQGRQGRQPEASWRRPRRSARPRRARSAFPRRRSSTP